MKRLAAVAVALSLVTASVAMADDHHDHGNRRDRSGDHRDFDGRHGDDHRGWQYDSRNRYGHEWRNDHDWRESRFRHEEYRHPWGYREHDWRRGERLPVAYYARPYIVGDYYAYGLRQPPYGCHWVRVNNDVVLAAIASGVVLDIVYNAF